MNKIILRGRLTKDVELKQTTTGKSIANFSLAVNRKFKNQQGEYETDFFNVQVWGKLGELCSQYLSKGKDVLIVGEMQFEKYTDKDGNNRQYPRVNASDVEFLTPKQDNSNNSYQNSTQGNTSSRNNQTSQDSDSDFEDLNDDSEIIPF